MYYKYRYKELFDNIPKTDFEAESGNIVIYGAGFQGLLASQLLKEKGIKVLCFCDIDEKKQGTIYNGYPVYSPVKAKELYPEALVVVTPYSIVPAFNYVKNELGFKKIVTPVTLFFEFDSTEFDKLPELPDWYHTSTLDYNLDVFFRNCNNLLNDNKLYSIDVSVTEVCNLKCKHCTSLMPCYEKPKHFTLEDMIYYIDTITKGKMFHHFNVEGGEAFVWKPLPEFLNYLTEMPNLMNVYLYTNGVVIPNEKLLKALKHPKITVRISDYGSLSKIDELVDLFEKNDIQYKVALQKWCELSVFSKKEKEGAELKRVIDTCCKVQPEGNGGCYVINGKMYYCPIQGNLDNLGIYKSREEDYVDLNNRNDFFIQDKIEKMLNKKTFPELCKHCDGRGVTGIEVPPAVQLKPGEKIEVRFE